MGTCALSSTHPASPDTHLCPHLIPAKQPQPFLPSGTCSSHWTSHWQSTRSHTGEGSGDPTIL